MKSKHDQNLTSWALNELGAEERAAFEDELRQDPALRAEAEANQSFCQFLIGKVRDEEAGLTEAQRERLRLIGPTLQHSAVAAVRAPEAEPLRPVWWRRPAFILPLSAAAALVVAGVLHWQQQQASQSPLLVAYPISPTPSEPVVMDAVAPTGPAIATPLAADAASIAAGTTITAQPAFTPVLAAIGERPRRRSLNGTEADLDKLDQLTAAAGEVAKLDGLKPVVTPTTRRRLITAPANSTAPVVAALGDPAVNTFAGTTTLTMNGGSSIAFGNTTLVGSIEFSGVAFTRADQPMTDASLVSFDVKLTAPLQTAKVGKQMGQTSPHPLAVMPENPLRKGNSVASSAQSVFSQTPPDLVELVDSPRPTVALHQSGMGGFGSGLGMGGAAGGRPRSDNLVRGSVALLPRQEKELEEVRSARDSDGRAIEGFRIPAQMTPAKEPPSGEAYAAIVENALTETAKEPLSTFAIDVDTAAYANVRRFLNNGTRPPRDAVRIEELVNYFPYDYEFPQQGDAPFTVAAAVAEAPWSPGNRLARIAIKGREIGMERRLSNFVFLVDVSGSMNEPDKLPLVQQSLNLLTGQLTADDRVAIVVYAGSSGVVLSSTAGDQKEAIRGAISRMQAGGSTHGSAGIRQAYDEARRNFIKEGVNRVILCTDGDFNVGTTSTEELEKLIIEQAKSGVFLSVLGYGTGNTKDTIMETLADKGNGNYAYIDGLGEARKVLVEQMRGTLVTIAKDVKVQVEFNPAVVRAYRLIGYENRALAKEDFNNDAKDAGEIGAGHTVTALYEIVPVGAAADGARPPVDDLKYQKPAPPPAALSPAAQSGEMMTVKLRFKKPEGDRSDYLDFPVTDEKKMLAASERDFQFAAAVASFGLLLRESSYKGDLTWDQVRQLALAGKGDDPSGYRGEFVQLVEKARGLMGDGRP